MSWRLCKNKRELYFGMEGVEQIEIYPNLLKLKLWGVKFIKVY